MIKKFEVHNMSVFSDFDLNFSSGLNVIMGENGCGKSHLVKALYAILSTSYGLSKGC